MANQTFKDFVVECEMYNRSRENYELVKECSELLLMEQYIGNQQFMAESKPVLESSGVVLTEGYFAEAAEASTINALMEQTEAKKTSIMKKIWEGFKKLLQKVGTFFVKLVNQIDSVTRDAEDTLAALRKVELTQEDVDSLLDIHEKIWTRNDGQNASEYRYKQPYAKNLKLKYAAGVEKNVDLLEWNLSVAFSNTYVCLTGVDDSANSRSEGYVGAIPAEALVKACKGLVNAKKKYDVDSLTSHIDGAWADVKQNGLIVNVNSKSINNVITALQNLEKAVAEKAGADAAAATADGQDAQVVAALNASYAKVNTCIGATIRVYSQYVSFRKRMIAAVKGFVTQKENSSKGASQK